MRLFLFLFLLQFIFSGCATSADSQLLTTVKSSDVATTVEETSISLSPGEIRLASRLIPGDTEVTAVTCSAKNIPYYINGSEVRFLVVVSYFFEKDFFECQINLHDIKRQSDIIVKIPVSVVPRVFKEEALRVDPSKVHLSKKDLKRYEKEKAILSEVYKGANAKKSLSGRRFMIPLDSAITSYYGTKRMFNGVRQSQHLGIDLKATIGTPVSAAADGDVVYVGDLFFSGKTVIIDHGQDLFTMYAHLSKIQVKKGQAIKIGEKIGLSGMTGRVSGPHLHWGSRAQGQWVDGSLLVGLGF